MAKADESTRRDEPNRLDDHKRVLENALENATDDTLDEELADLFSAFSGVKASDELKSATLAAIFALDKQGEGEGAAVASAVGAAGATEAIETTEPTVAAKSTEAAKPSPIAETAPVAASATSTQPHVTATAGGKQARSTRKAKWRAIRIGAIAACLALALTGGVAYATPAKYYDIEQGDTTVTLGVNVFGITVSATSPDDAGTGIIDATNLCNMPYEQSLERAIESFEQHDPTAPVAFGPQGGERTIVEPPNMQNAQGTQGNQGAQNPQGEAQGQGSGWDGQAGQPQGGSADTGQPQGGEQPQGEPQGGESSPGGENPQGGEPADNTGAPDGGQTPDSPQGAGGGEQPQGGNAGGAPGQQR